MKINNVQNNQTHFNGFYVTKKGAWNLAEKFVEKPELEGLFMQKVVKPLRNTKHADTLYDGCTAGMIENGKKQGIAVVHAYGGSEHVIGTARYPDYTRFAYYRHTELKPTKYFHDYPLSEIEVAKNITLDKEAEIEKNIEPYKDKLLNQAAIDKYTQKYGNESVQEKADRLFAQLGRKEG